MSNIYLGLQLLHHVQTMAFAEHSVLNNNGNVGTASPCGWPENFSCHLPVFAVDVDLSDGGKLSYGFTSADDLEEVDIGPGDKLRPTFISKKFDPILCEQMIALLKSMIWHRWLPVTRKQPMESMWRFSF